MCRAEPDMKERGQSGAGDAGAAGTEVGGRRLHRTRQSFGDCRAWGEDGRAGGEAHIPKAEPGGETSLGVCVAGLSGECAGTCIGAALSWPSVWAPPGAHLCHPPPGCVSF